MKNVNAPRERLCYYVRSIKDIKLATLNLISTPFIQRVIMEVSVKSFGTLAAADVHIGGLTVITGENDTGKSTIGKILFSLIKAVARYEEDLEEEKEDRVIAEAERIYFGIRRSINIASHVEFRDMFHPRKFYSHLKLDQARAIHERFEMLKIISSIADNSSLDFESYYQSLNKIATIMSEPDDKISVITRAVRKSFYSEFKGEIISKGMGESAPAELSITDGASNLIDIVWGRKDDKEGIQQFRYVDDLGYADATYVDSPAIMQYHHLVKMARTLFDHDPSRLAVPLHVKDLANKLSDSKYGFTALTGLQDEPSMLAGISVAINNMFGGVISYDDDSSDFVLNRNGFSVGSSNIASGIKALGVLEMLVAGGSVKKNTLLILDEPEVNLHPKWQVDYSQVICQLVAFGVDVIVTTHSPYIVEALKHYADLSGIEKRFYLASKGMDVSSRIDDITEDISVAIDRLADPLDKLSRESIADFFG